jgi:CheY-like chemotaxis protein
MNSEALWCWCGQGALLEWRSSVPRILVADDNSNIHRTVALALKEAGVEVVAVGNGEAAVRKIAEIMPDLVLADIFMPVRSGYEVCEFVKKDPRFSQIPVVLLIGAFDPFDEREAQRVQADAILKKPFVPPDSLLRTVADLLAQSASRPAPAPAAASPAQAERPSSRAPASEAPTSEYMDEAPEESSPAKARLDWGSNEQPLAFGTLLETPAPGTVTDESVMTSRRDPNLGEPAFGVPNAHAEGEEGEPETDGSEQKSPMELGEDEQRRSGAGANDLPAQTSAVAEAAQAESLMDLQESAPSLPELAPLEMAPPEDFAMLPTLDSFSALPGSTVDAPPEAAENSQESVLDLKDFSWTGPTAPAEQTAPQSESAQKVDPASEEELIEAAGRGLATLAPFLAGLTSAASSRTSGGKDPFDFGPAPALPGDFQDDSPELESAELTDPPVTPRLDPAVIEAIAQRVIERMQPSIIELVTRELLRPAVEALVQRELERK